MRKAIGVIVIVPVMMEALLIGAMSIIPVTRLMVIIGVMSIEPVIVALAAVIDKVNEAVSGI